MSKHTKEPMNLADVIRRAIKESGLLRSELARRSGLAYSAVHRFCDGYDLSTASASKLCAVLGLELRPAAAKGRK